MAKVYRVFAEKKKGNDIEASNMLNDLKENVGIKGIEENIFALIFAIYITS